MKDARAHPTCAGTATQSIGIENLRKIVISRPGDGLTEQLLIPLEAPRHVAYSDDGPCALHCALLRLLPSVFTEYLHGDRSSANAATLSN